jgi:hypothetical protein
MKIFKLIPVCLSLKILINNIIKAAFISTSIVFFTGCFALQTGSESWEGITGETLKVTVYEFFLFEENASSEEIKNHIMIRLNQRAALLIASHLSMNLSRDKISKSNDIILNNKINEIIESGKLTDYICSENNYCSANSEYNVGGLQKILESINNQP